MTKFDSKPGDWKFDHGNKEDHNSSTKKIGEGNMNPFSQIALIFSFLRDYTSKKYTGVSKFSVFLLIFGIIYVISPIDILSELYIPIIGYVDDVALIAFIVNRWNKELEKYRIWKKGK